MDRDHYQYLIDERKYCSEDTSPGIKYLPDYKKFIRGTKVLDLGSGTGETVEALRNYKEGVLKSCFNALGVDWVKSESPYCIEADITDKKGPIAFLTQAPHTILCIDVLSHISEFEVDSVLDMLNSSNATKIIGIEPGPEKVEGINLHKTSRDIYWWDAKITRHFGKLLNCFEAKNERRIKFYITR